MNKNIEKEISFMLYNYKYLDKLIDKRKEELINTIDSSGEAWNKSKTQIYGHTLEDIIIRIDCDDKINRLENWKKLLGDFFFDLYLKDDLLIASVIKLKYLDKKETIYIEKELNLTENEINYICNKVKKVIYESAKDLFMYKVDNNE